MKAGLKDGDCSTFEQEEAVRSLPQEEAVRHQRSNVEAFEVRHDIAKQGAVFEAPTVELGAYRKLVARLQGCGQELSGGSGLKWLQAPACGIGCRSASRALLGCSGDLVS